MKILPALSLILVVMLSSCSPMPTPDAPATETAIAARIFATLTAAAPMPVLIPATAVPSTTPVQPVPTATSAPSDTPVPPAATPTASATLTPTLVATALPATSPPTPKPAAPAPTRVPAAVPAKKSLEVVYINLHYECQMTEWADLVRVWGYRSFQADMFIKNNSGEPVQPPWSPQQWIITDGANDRTSDLIWEWGRVQARPYNQPVIAPGQSAGWTFMAFPVERNEWVKAVEFEWQGQVYRTEFDLGPLGNAHNYKDCGEYPPLTGPRTPVPVNTPSEPGAGDEEPPAPTPEPTPER